MISGGALFWQMQNPSAQIYTSSAQGPRWIALKEGVAVRLDRNSRISVRQGDVAEVSLEKGAAYFTAPSDPDPAFDVMVGAYHIRDIGTRFAVTRGQDGQAFVAVARGAVAVADQKGARVRLDKGQAAALPQKSGKIRLYRIAPAQVASWQQGQLAYEQAPLAQVIADLARTSGLTLALDPRIANQDFTGVIVIGDGTQLVADFAHLTGLVPQRQGQTIYFRPADREQR